MRSDTRHVRLRRLAAQPWLRWGLGGAVVFMGTIAVGAALAPGGRHAEPREGPRLQIALATPPEPVIAPGEVMDVGELRNEFDRQVLARAEAERQAQAALHDAYFIDAMGEDDAAPPPHPDDIPRVTVSAPLQSSPPPEPAPLGRPEGFGFDVPRPDYAAERRARMIAREARMAEREQRHDRKYFSSINNSHRETTDYVDIPSDITLR